MSGATLLAQDLRKTARERLNLAAHHVAILTIPAEAPHVHPFNGEGFRAVWAALLAFHVDDRVRILICGVDTADTRRAARLMLNVRLADEARILTTDAPQELVVAACDIGACFDSTPNAEAWIAALLRAEKQVVIDADHSLSAKLRNSKLVHFSMGRTIRERARAMVDAIGQIDQMSR